MSRRPRTPEEQLASFWNSVAITADDNKCWEWQRSCSQDGYGRKYWRGQNVYTHKIAWMLPDYIIPKGLDICHACDNPKCVNPKHLFLGTRQDNVDDMMKKGRYVSNPAIGENHGHCKLTDKQVTEIRERYTAGGITQVQLATEYDTHYSNISMIVNGLRRTGQRNPVKPYTKRAGC